MSPAERLVRAVADGLGGRLVAEVVAGDHWAFDARVRVLHVRRADLSERSMEWCLAIAAHEVGHAFATRYFSMKVRTRLESREIRLAVLNALEDPRVEAFMRKCFPGTRLWFHEIESDWRRPAPAAARSLVGQFCDEVAREPRVGWLPQEPGILDPRVVRALAATRQARRRYVDDHLPPDPLSVDDREVLRARHVTLVVPRLAAGVVRSDTNWERAADIAQVEALVEAERHVLPALERLERLDARRARRPGNGAAAGLGARVRPLLARIGSRKKPAVASTSPIRPAVGAVARCTARSAERPHVAGSAPRILPGSQACPDSPEELLRKATPLARRIALALRAALPPGAPERPCAGFMSGIRPDVHAVIQGIASGGRRAGAPWMRRTSLSPPRAAAHLLVDCSGSMRGAGIAAAVEGGLALALGMGSLRLPFAVSGFQDDLLPILGFGDFPHPRALAHRMADMERATRGALPGQRTSPKWNDDGPCLLEAAATLRVQPCLRRLLIVISDGAPQGRRSGARHLSEAVARVQSEGIVLVGLGLGPRTGHVAFFYPIARTDVRPSDLGDVLRELLRRAMLPSRGLRPA